MQRKKVQIALAPPVFERPWTGWQLLAGRVFEAERHPMEPDGNAAEVAFLHHYLELADKLLACDEDEGEDRIPRSAWRITSPQRPAPIPR